MSSAGNSGKVLNELRTQSGSLQSHIIDSAGSAIIDLTSVKTAYVSWIHPIDGPCTFTYYGDQIFSNPDLVAAGYGLDLPIGSIVTITDLESPLPIELKNCVITATSGKAKISFGRL